MLKLDYGQIIRYILKIILFLKLCGENNIIFRDFKFSRIGYEFIDSEIQFVVLDYNDTTLLKKTDTFFDTFKDGCDAMCVGTLVPYFIIHDFFEMEINWKSKLDKIYSIGFAETLIFLLYSQDKSMENIFKYIYGPSRLKPCLHYYHFMKLFDDEGNKSIFYKLITTLKPKFIEIEPKINQMFTRIIQNCFETKYENIKILDYYLEHINKTIFEFNKEKSDIRTFIEPIDTLTFDEISHASTYKTLPPEDVKTTSHDLGQSDINQFIDNPVIEEPTTQKPTIRTDIKSISKLTIPILTVDNTRPKLNLKPNSIEEIIPVINKK